MGQLHTQPQMSPQSESFVHDIGPPSGRSCASAGADESVRQAAKPINFFMVYPPKGSTERRAS